MSHLDSISVPSRSKMSRSSLCIRWSISNLFVIARSAAMKQCQSAADEIATLPLVARNGYKGHGLLIFCWSLRCNCSTMHDITATQRFKYQTTLIKGLHDEKKSIVL